MMSLLHIFISLVSTVAFFLMALYLFKKWAIGQAHKEAQEILKDIQNEKEVLELDLIEKKQELENKIFSPYEKELNRLEEKIHELDLEIEEETKRLSEVKNKLSENYRETQSQVDSYQHKMKEKLSHLESLKEERTQQKKNFKKALESHLNANSEKLVKELSDSEIQEWTHYFEKWVRECEAQTKDQTEVLSKKILNRVLNRFHRPYCSERGIPYVEMDPERPHQKEKLLDAQGENIKTITQITGCDILVEEERNSISVGGFDPVRREFARRVLERALREKYELNPEKIKQFAETIRKELMAHIKRDGDLMTKELGLQNVAVEIRKMLGSLRYRYSFTQNQYFHCTEVGWLCGLISSELGLDIKTGRRAGAFHDLGKAMDHEFEGGHAVIGAQFIEKHGEAPDIVHAVKAHHYDETPSTPLAFAVIAADAISGSRPGARRSTMESYNQKIDELESIARSFKGVSDCIILNGGRECRIKVDAFKVDDVLASQIAKDVTKRIEEECSYPGQIKVVVVRESVASEGRRSDHR